jgi:hypothetical protein
VRRIVDFSEYPFGLRLLSYINEFVWWLILLGGGIAFIVLGRTPGKLVGIAIVVIWIAIGVLAVRRRLKSESDPDGV